MRTLYLDCGMGAAGDMLTAALAELLPEPDRFAEQMNALGIPGVRFSMESVMKSGIRGTKVTVKIHGETEDEKPAHTHPPVHAHEHTHHHHSGMEEIRRIIDGLPIPETIRNEICAVYEKIAEAESRVHGVPVMQIHFHEVGTMDAIADITAVCLLMDQLKPEQVIVSPVHVGSGHIVCAHGVLPVPAPATAYLLKDIPIYGGKIEGELCTPTGAALLRHFATRFGDMPVMRTQAIGYGMGKREFETVNCLRAMLGDAEAVPDPVCELSCNVDDMTGEEIGFAVDRIRESGALDVCAIPLMMKKSRPGTMIQVLCREQDRDSVLAAMFSCTTTIGIRETAVRRYVMDRETEEIQTAYGLVRRKRSAGFGAVREKYEYEDLARIAAEQGCGIAEIRNRISACRAEEQKGKHR